MDLIEAIGLDELVIEAQIPGGCGLSAISVANKALSLGFETKIHHLAFEIVNGNEKDYFGHFINEIEGLGIDASWQFDQSADGIESLNGVYFGCFGAFRKIYSISLNEWTIKNHSELFQATPDVLAYLSPSSSRILCDHTQPC